MRIKQFRPKEERNVVIHEVPCANCDHVYSGETSRSVKEHRYVVKTGNMKNGITAHAWNHDHQVNQEVAKVRLLEKHLWKRKVLEAIHI